MKQRNWYTIFLLSTCIVAGMIYIAGVYAPDSMKIARAALQYVFHHLAQAKLFSSHCRHSSLCLQIHLHFQAFHIQTVPLSGNLRQKEHL